MRVTIQAVLLTVFFAGGAVAQTTDVEAPAPLPHQEEIAAAVSVCLSTTTSMARLACYDAALGYEPGQADPSASRSVSGGWQFVENEDEFTNSNTSYVYLRSDRANATFSDAPAELVVRCDGNGASEVYVRANGYIGARRDSIPVRYRFGDSAPIRESWNESTNGRAAFLPYGYRDFLAGLATRQDFIFEMTDFRGTRHSASFDGLSENDDLLEFVLGGCSS